MPRNGLTMKRDANASGPYAAAGSDSGFETEKSNSQVADLEEALPTERMSVDRQVNMLKAIHTLGGESRAPLMISQIAQHLNVAVATAGPAARFLITASLLDGGRGIYAITEAGSQFATLWDSDTARARLLLRGLWSETWFARKTARELANGPLSESELAKRLQQGKSGPTTRGLYLVEWMTMALLVQRDEMGMITYASPGPQAPSSPKPESTDAPPPIVMGMTIGQIRELPDRQYVAYMTAIEAIFQVS